MTRLIIPELGHVVQQLQQMTTKMRPFAGTIPLDEARAIDRRRGRADRPHGARARSRTPTDACWRSDVVADRRRAAVRARGDGRLRGSRRGHGRREPRRRRGRCAASRQVFTGQMPARTVGAGRVHRDRHRRADARGRRRGRHGRRDRRATRRATVRVFAPVAAGPEHRPPGRRHPAAARRCCSAGDVLNAEPRRRARGARPHRRGRLRAAARRDPLDRQRDRRSRRSRSRPARSTTSTASRSSAVVAEHGGDAGALPHGRRHASTTSRARSTNASQEDVLVFSGGSSVGERDLILDVIAAKGEVLFHGIAVKPGKPTAFGRIGGKLVFGMPGYPTSCLSNAYILLVPALRRMARLPPHAVAHGDAPARPARSCRRPAGTSSTRCASSTAWRCRRSRRRATSRACRRRTATSRSRPTRTSSRRARSVEVTLF